MRVMKDGGEWWIVRERWRMVKEMMDSDGGMEDRGSSGDCWLVWERWRLVTEGHGGEGWRLVMERWRMVKDMVDSEGDMETEEERDEEYERQQ
ncbi:hypothetical protein Pcinc_042416 [Petrolisthes cinctipes]|uniref:Uncharacterized protein n=1 Tax=Petrolisthes cinctipes TaxID=88211 RepID=A0AAE1EIW2_PETCI|nr:hypothetical protein Pcinc_042416 [Petrolisthes cinctipes]